MKDFKPHATNAEAVFQVVKDAVNVKDALIVLDTNVLLAPYRSSTEGFEAIIKTYAKLRDQKRLFVPAQAAREFARNRPSVLTQLHKSIEDARAISINGKFEYLPILETTDEYKEASNNLEEIKKLLKNFKNKVQDLADKIASWQNDDPVLQAYRPLFDSSVVIEQAEERNNIQNAKKFRFDAGIPPGNKDANKEDGGIGDLIIWATILDLGKSKKKDLIFVTEETKGDWFHRFGEHRLFPRYELIEEYSGVSGGCSFDIFNLSSLLKNMGIDEAVADEFLIPSGDGLTINFSDPLRFPVYRKLISQMGNLNYDLASSNDKNVDYILYVDGSRIALVIIDASVLPSATILGSYLSNAIDNIVQYDEVVFIFAGRDEEIASLTKIISRTQLHSSFSFILMVLSESEVRVVANNSQHSILHMICNLY